MKRSNISQIEDQILYDPGTSKFSPAEGDEEFGPRGADGVGMWFSVGCMDFSRIVEK